MNEELVRTFIETVLELRKKGVSDDQMMAVLKSKSFHFDESEFQWILEMISTGAFRAAMMSSGAKYPKSNLNVEDDVFLKTSFKMHWIASKGEAHYLENYENRKKRWWEFWR